MEFFIIYLFVMVEKLASLFDKGYVVMLAGLCLIGISVLIASFNVLESDKTVSEVLKQGAYKTAVRCGKWAATLGLIFGLMGGLMPSQKELAIIVGSGVTYNVLTSEPAKQLGSKALALIEQRVDAALADEPLSDKVQKELSEQALKKLKPSVTVEKVEGAAL